MFKWLILGFVVALVSYWSSREVYADSPLSEGEQELLVTLKETLEGSNGETDKRRLLEDSDSCEEYCQYEDSFEDCVDDCENSIERRMFEEAIAQEENLKRALGSDSSVSKKFIRIPWRAPRIPRIHRIRIPSIPRIRIPSIPRIPRIRWGKK